MGKVWKEIQIDVFNIKDVAKVTIEISYKSSYRHSTAVNYLKLLNTDHRTKLFYEDILEFIKEDNIELYAKKGKYYVLVFKRTANDKYLDFFSVMFNETEMFIKRYYTKEYILKNYSYTLFKKLLPEACNVYGLGSINISDMDKNKIWDIYIFNKVQFIFSEIARNHIDEAVIHSRLNKIVKTYKLKNLLFGLKYRGRNLIGIKVYVYPTDINYASVPTI